VVAWVDSALSPRNRYPALVVLARPYSLRRDPHGASCKVSFLTSPPRACDQPIASVC
jgi:hypothetical protein